MKKIIVCLDNNGHYPNEYREVTEEEYEQLRIIEEKYGYLDSATKKNYKFVKKILKRKEIEILEIIKYC